MSNIFDRKRVRQHASRARGESDFLLREMAERLCERLEDITRSFSLALDLGAHHGVVAEVLGSRGGIETLVQMESSQELMAQTSGLHVIADEEFLPFADDSFDLILSVGALHWVNDLPGTLIQIRRALKPDGLFLAMLPGGRTLMELRHAFEHAEAELRGGLSPRISPFVDVRDSGSLLQRAGFALPVVDSELLTVSYEHPLKLLHDLRTMGQSNALVQSTKGMLRRDVLARALEYYQTQYTGTDGRIPATFELVTLTAWKPHASQQKPAARGSGQVHLGNVLKD